MDSTSITVKWRAPGSPNGKILNYFLVTSLGRSQSIPSDTLAFKVASLAPFTAYNVVLQACNVGGCGASAALKVTTKPGAPSGQSPPVAFPLSGGKSLLAQWDVPSKQNGVFDRYELYIGADGEVPSKKVYSGTDTKFVVESLEPATKYGLRIFSFNKEPKDQGVGSFVRSYSTADAQPIKVDAPTVAAVAKSSTDISVKITEPAKPQGVILSYLIMLDGQPELLTKTADTFKIGALDAFTEYTVSYKACTAGGCTASPGVKVKTNPGKAAGQAAPQLEALSASEIKISWSVPSKPNGVIKEFAVEKQNTNGEYEAIFKAKYEEGADLSVVDKGLKVYTTYRYRVVVTNTEGSTASEGAVARTGEGSPSGLDKPAVAVVDPYTLRVAWKPPKVANGKLVAYDILLTVGSKLAATATVDASQTSAQVTKGVTPNTAYSVSIVARNSVSKTSSPAAQVQTPESVPETWTEGIKPVAAAHNAVTVAWNVAQPHNGKLTRGFVFVYNQGKVNSESELSKHAIPTADLAKGLLTITGAPLEANKAFDVVVTACTKVGCVASPAVSVTTLKTKPQAMKAATLKVLGNRKVELSWSAPLSPNQPLLRHVIFRDDKELHVVKGGDLGSTTFVDTSVTPGKEYTFRVQAHNDEGFSETASAKVQMPEDVPEGVSAPVIKVVSSSALAITWEAPEKSNGEITKYALFHSRDAKSMNATLLYEGSDRTFSLTKQEPYSFNVLRLKVCTKAGCSFSVQSSARTAEEAPGGVNAPVVATVAATQAFVVWGVPAKPNGVISKYELWMQGTFASKPVGTKERTVTAKIANTDFLHDSIRTHSVSKDSSGAVLFGGKNSITVSKYTTGPVGASFSIALDFVQTKTSNGQYLLAKSDNLGRRYYSIYTAPALGGLNVYYRIAGSTRVYKSTFTKQLADGKRHKLLLSVSGSKLTVIIDEDKPVVRDLEGEVDDCGSVSKTCLLQLASLPPGSSRYGYFFQGKIYGAMLFPKNALTSFPDVPSIVAANAEKPWRLVYTGKQPTHTVSNLVGFSKYTMYVVAATSAGETASSKTKFDTPEAAPSGVKAPAVKLLKADVAQVTWSNPDAINGNLTDYQILFTDGADNKTSVLYKGKQPGTKDIADLTPYTTYAFQMTASTKAGVGRSDVTTVTTPDGKPTGLAAPIFDSVGSRFAHVQWAPPAKPVGLIIKYSLYQDNKAILEVARASGKYEDADFAVNVTNLRPTRQYKFSVVACNREACVQSDAQAASTKPALPDQPVPRLIAPTATIVYVAWGGASFGINGNLVQYSLKRRRRNSNNEIVKTVSLWQGKTDDYLDRSLAPATVYEYQVTAQNHLGTTVGPWKAVRTKYLRTYYIPFIPASFGFQGVIMHSVPPPRTLLCLRRFLLHNHSCSHICTHVRARARACVVERAPLLP